MSAPVLDRFAQARSVADAVLYEGYVLYPYRASSTKNQVRWQFGVLAPRAFCESDASERWWMASECLVQAGTEPVLTVGIRCLQPQRRRVERLEGPAGEGERSFISTDALDVDGVRVVAWDEAFEQAVELGPVQLSSLCAAPRVENFEFDPWSDAALITSAGGELLGRSVRCRQRVSCRVTVSAHAAGVGLVSVRVEVKNTTAAAGGWASRDEALGHSLAAVHILEAVDGGRFVSLLDPPDGASAAASACRQEGSYPVLIGDDDVVLSSPIILYDHPEVAPESPGDLYDATEIDEILALRVLTLTDEEKSEARGTDARAAAIIDRCDGMGPEQWERLHGTIRSIGPLDLTPPDGEWMDPGHSPPRPAEPPAAAPWWDPEADAAVDPWSDSVVIAGRAVRKGTAVVLRPSHRADAQDFFLAGMRATVAGVFSDVDGDVQVAVTVDADPAAEELVWQGRYLFFHPDEVEPIDEEGQR